LSTFLVASADEFHQSFLPNRTGQFRDVLLDSCGALVLGLLLFLVMGAIEGRRRAQIVAIRGREPVFADLAA
jgi:VanZ family protein